MQLLMLWNVPKKAVETWQCLLLIFQISYKYQVEKNSICLWKRVAMQFTNTHWPLHAEMQEWRDSQDDPSWWLFEQMQGASFLLLILPHSIPTKKALIVLDSEWISSRPSWWCNRSYSKLTSLQENRLVGNQQPPLECSQHARLAVMHWNGASHL